MAKTSANNRPQAKLLVAARIAPAVQDRIDALASALNRTRSEIIEFACQEISDLTPEEISKRIIKRAKAR